MSISNFKANFDGGTRRNRFKVSPAIVEGASNILANFSPYHVVSASLPASIITANPIDYQGRKIYYPGDRIYGEVTNLWNITVLDDLKKPTTFLQSLWYELYRWNNAINKHTKNVTDPQYSSFEELVLNIIVEQLDLNDTKVLKRATLFDCWPQSISKLDMEMQARDQYTEFDVTFCFRYVKYEDLVGTPVVATDPTSPTT